MEGIRGNWRKLEEFGGVWRSLDASQVDEGQNKSQEAIKLVLGRRGSTLLMCVPRLR